MRALRAAAVGFYRLLPVRWRTEFVTTWTPPQVCETMALNLSEELKRQLLYILLLSRPLFCIRFGSRFFLNTLSQKTAAEKRLSNTTHMKDLNFHVSFSEAARKVMQMRLALDFRISSVSPIEASCTTQTRLVQ